MTCSPPIALGVKKMSLSLWLISAKAVLFKATLKCPDPCKILSLRVYVPAPM